VRTKRTDLCKGTLCCFLIGSLTVLNQFWGSLFWKHRFCYFPIIILLAWKLLTISQKSIEIIILIKKMEYYYHPQPFIPIHCPQTKNFYFKYSINFLYVSDFPFLELHSTLIIQKKLKLKWRLFKKIRES
jgi:hypothetical protein